MTPAQALSLVGRCQSFSAGADGYGRGEGFAVIALRASGGSGGSIAVIKVGACFRFLECQIILGRHRRSGGNCFATSALRAVGDSNTVVGTPHRGQCSGVLLFVGLSSKYQPPRLLPAVYVKHHSSSIQQGARLHGLHLQGVCLRARHPEDHVAWSSRLPV